MFVLLFDLLSAIGIVAVAYRLYKIFFTPPATKDKTRETAYEKGFSDAVRYFGLKKLYEEDQVLKRRMETVFTEAGITHRIDELLDKAQERSTGQSSKAKTRENPAKAK